MRIFDATKTYELSAETIDMSKGYLKPDKKFVMHHEAVEAKEAEYRDRPVKHTNGSTSIYKDLVSPAVEGKEAYDEYEDIQVYIPYNDEELKNMLRAKRKNLLEAFDKWEKGVLRGREYDDNTIMNWRLDLLDLKETAFENIPERIKYYL